MNGSPFSQRDQLAFCLPKPLVNLCAGVQRHASTAAPLRAPLCAPLRTPLRTRAPHRANVPLRHTPRANMPGNIEDLPLERIPTDGSPMPAHWARPGVYGVYGMDGALNYVAAVADVAVAMRAHVTAVADPARVAAVRMMTTDAPDDAPLGLFAENWVRALNDAGMPVPPGNTDAAPEWRLEPTPSDVAFTNTIAGADAESRVSAEIEKILREHKVVLFMKGTRSSPRCGFSKAVVDVIGRQVGDAFVCVDCLDSAKNPGLREGIKRYTTWPTIPQLFVDGDFIGGADIVQEMDASGELVAALDL